MKNRKGFTLVELLLVIALIVMLTALTLPGIKSIHSAGHLNNAGNLVSDVINQARQMARARNSLVLLIIAEDSSGALNQLTLCERSAEATSWKQILRWETLPAGIAIDPAKSQLTALSPTPSPPTLKRGAGEISPEDYSYQVFLPDGRLLANANPVLYLASANASANFYRIVINSSTGVPIIERP